MVSRRLLAVYNADCEWMIEEYNKKINQYKKNGIITKTEYEKIEVNIEKNNYEKGDKKPWTTILRNHAFVYVYDL